MANNVQTASQWAQVAAEQQSVADAANAKEVEILSQLRPLAAKAETLEQEITRFNQVITRANSAIARGETLSPSAQSQFDTANSQLAAKKSELDQVQAALGPLRSTQGQLATQRVEATRAANEAKAQQAKAESGPPNDNSTVQPAGASTNANSTGNNTDVVVTPVPAPTPNTSTITILGEGSDPGVLATPDGTIEGEGDAGTGLQEPPVPEEEDGAAEGGNTVGNADNVNFDGAAEGGNTVGNAANINPDDDPAVRALMESSRQEAEDSFEFDDAPNTDDFGPPPAQKQTPPPPAAKDWRVRISLAKSANYFYSGDNPGILRPLISTGGVIFPYTPTISVAYNAKYDSQTLTHSNFNINNYTGSSVDQITITGDFTAQDTTEAAYMLAVIHFFRSATKMFYGKDQNPNRGTPPPLLYLSGHGNYQFDNHPMVLTNFTYSLPTDVDYINAYPDGSGALNTMPLAPYNRPNTAKPSPMQRLLGSGLQPGGTGKKPIFVNSPSGVEVVTRVPTKISISLNFLPVVTRNAITNEFSLKKYATGELLRGSKNPGTGGGIW